MQPIRTIITVESLPSGQYSWFKIMGDILPKIKVISFTHDEIDHCVTIEAMLGRDTDLEEFGCNIADEVSSLFQRKSEVFKNYLLTGASQLSLVGANRPIVTIHPY